MLQSAVKLQKSWKVVVDPGCGAAYSVAPRVLNTIGCKTTALNAQADGYFPARSSEPTAESLSNYPRLYALWMRIWVCFMGMLSSRLVDEDGKFVTSIVSLLLQCLCIEKWAAKL
jgi:hypothetical protein